jgi:hypothetical protein
MNACAKVQGHIEGSALRLTLAIPFLPNRQSPWVVAFPALFAELPLARIVVSVVVEKP